MWHNLDYWENNDNASAWHWSVNSKPGIFESRNIYTKEVRLQSCIVLDCQLQNYGQEIWVVVKNIYSISTGHVIGQQTWWCCIIKLL